MEKDNFRIIDLKCKIIRNTQELNQNPYFKMGKTNNAELYAKARKLVEYAEDTENPWPTKAELEEAGREDNTKKICELKLHEKWWVEGFEVLRVPGGWIYAKNDRSVFVPYNDEGSEKIKL